MKWRILILNSIWFFENENKSSIKANTNLTITKNYFVNIFFHGAFPSFFLLLMEKSKRKVVYEIFIKAQWFTCWHHCHHLHHDWRYRNRKERSSRAHFTFSFPWREWRPTKSQERAINLYENPQTITKYSDLLSIGVDDDDLKISAVSLESLILCSHSRWLSMSFNRALLLWDNNKHHDVNRCKLPPHAVAPCSGERRQLLSTTNTNCNLLDGKINQCFEWILGIDHWEVIWDIIVSSAVSMEIKLEK